MATMMAQWAEARPDLRILADRSRRSPTVTALELRNGPRAAEVVKTLESRDWLIATGLSPLAKSVIRIGHMGDLEPSHLADLLHELETVL